MNIELCAQENRRYARHLSLPGVGLDGQKRLKTAKVLCVGAGGLGSPALFYLAAAGIGTIGIVDDDTIATSNLQRQILYTDKDTDKAKVLVAKEVLQAHNPYIQINHYKQRITAENAFEIFAPYDIILDGSDNFATRYLVNDVCFHLQKPLVFASIFQFEGQCSIFNSEDGPCYRCLFPAPPPPELIPNCAEGGVLGVLPGIMGTLQALQAIKLILNLGDSLVGRLLCFDAVAMTFQEFAIKQNPHCLLCGENTPFEQLPRYDQGVCTMNDVPAITIEEFIAIQQNDNESFTLIDVREVDEYQQCHIEGSQLIPLGELPSRLNELNKQERIIIHCHSGGRSARAVALLLEQGFPYVENLTGGIMAWQQAQSKK